MSRKTMRRCAIVQYKLLFTYKPPTQSYIFGSDSNGWLTAECPSVVVSSTFSTERAGVYFQIGYNRPERRQGGWGYETASIHILRTEKHVIQMRMISVLMYHIAPLDGNVSTGKSSAKAQALWNLSPSLPPSFLFSHYFPGDDPALIPNNGEFIGRILSSRLRQTIIRYDGK